MGIYCLQKKIAVSRVPGKVVVQKRSVKCTATVYDNKDNKIASQSAKNGENDAGAQRIINSSEFYANLAGVTRQESWGKFHCAEPNSLAKAIKERDDKGSEGPQIEYAIISDAKDIYHWDQESKGLVPRCRNCRQWCPKPEKKVIAAGKKDE